MPPATYKTSSVGLSDWHYTFIGTGYQNDVPCVPFRILSNFRVSSYISADFTAHLLATRHDLNVLFSEFVRWEVKSRASILKIATGEGREYLRSRHWVHSTGSQFKYSRPYIHTEVTCVLATGTLKLDSIAFLQPPERESCSILCRI